MIATRSVNKCHNSCLQDKYDEVYDPGMHNLPDRSMPQYLQIKTLVLLVEAADTGGLREFRFSLLVVERAANSKKRKHRTDAYKRYGMSMELQRKLRYQARRRRRGWLGFSRS